MKKIIEKEHVIKNIKYGCIDKDTKPNDIACQIQTVSNYNKMIHLVGVHVKKHKMIQIPITYYKSSYKLSVHVMKPRLTGFFLATFFVLTYLSVKQNTKGQTQLMWLVNYLPQTMTPKKQAMVAPPDSSFIETKIDPYQKASS